MFSPWPELDLLVRRVDPGSPVQFMGPKRVVPPAFTVDHPDLPKIDAVLLSHNHFGEGKGPATAA